MKEKEVKVIDIDGKEIYVKQYCQHIIEKDRVLLSGSNYDNENKIYHRYLDCYEDWPYPYKMDFDHWTVENIKNLDGYKMCSRCMDRTYVDSHPDDEYQFHYYFE